MFRFCTRFIKDTADKILEEFDDICESLGIDYYLVYGTCLGFYRDKGYTSGDHDIDVMPVCSDDKFLSLVKAIQRHGYVFRLGISGARWYGHAFKNDILLDIWREVDHHSYSYRNDPAHMATFFESFDTIVHHGRTYNVPSPVEDYLEFVYGTNWVNPRWPKEAVGGESQKNALVTGGAGFIGNHLVRYLRDKGYWVRAVDIRPPPFSDTQADDFDWNCDLRYDYQADYAMRGIDHVYALAADMGGAGFVFTGRNDLEIMANNTRINLNTLEAARATGVERYLFSSSACIYPEGKQLDPNSPPLREDQAYPAAPDSEYGWEKLYAERLCLAYARTTDIEVRIARFHNVYGPMGSWNDGREKAPAALCRKIAEAKLSGDPRVEIWGDGRATRSFCYIDDCLEMLYRLMNSDCKVPLNIGTDRSISINDLAHMIATIAQIDVELVHVPGPQGVRGRNADLTKMIRELGYVPGVFLEAGLTCLYDWVEQQVREHLRKNENELYSIHHT